MRALLVYAFCSALAVADARAIVGGTVDTGDAPVVAVIARRSRCQQTNLTVMCTGTVIAPRVVLTAAHCLTLADAAGSYEVFVDTQARFVAVSDVHKHPSYMKGSSDHDVALLRLAEPVTVAPAMLRSGPLDVTSVGASLRVVGFGTTGPAATPDALKRQGSMTLAQVDALTVRVTPPSASVCNGDLGAPLFLSGELAAVVALGDPACAQQAVAVRSDTLIAGFIQPYLSASAAAPLDWGPSAFAPDQICSSHCATAADCPAALGCLLETGVDGQCQLTGLGWANYGAACGSDDQCAAGEVCARLWPDSCRCAQPCGAQPPPGGCGCVLAGAPRDLGLLPVLLLTALLLAACRRLKAR